MTTKTVKYDKPTETLYFENEEGHITIPLTNAEKMTFFCILFPPTVFVLYHIAKTYL